jgi:1,4-alpha-glucan branching enzyme
MDAESLTKLVPPEDVRNVAKGHCSDPFRVLGMHRPGQGRPLQVRVFDPRAQSVEVLDRTDGSPVAHLEVVDRRGFFAGEITERSAPFPYVLKIRTGDNEYVREDPYRFGPYLGELDCHLMAEGRHLRPYEKLGAHVIQLADIRGVAFAVWAPNAFRVSVVGDFNNWDGRVHAMRNRGDCGIWEIFIPGLGPGTVYKYEIKTRDGTILPLKADPYAFFAETRPATASIVYGLRDYPWKDDAWMGERARTGQSLDRPMAIYEVHAGSWRRKTEQGNRYLIYREMADELLPYVKNLGFTHLEFLPLHEHPFDGSWGYQPTGLYAPTSRFGSPDDFKFLVDCAHQMGIGIIVDWVPGHFPIDVHALEYFDGTHLYEHADPRMGRHMDWGTLIYNHGRTEVQNFLIGNALYWVDYLHVDGLRVDAVASLLYLDYSRKTGEWIPNRFGGNENLDSIAFLRRMNEIVYTEGRGAMTLAEESTAWPMVSRPPYLGGLGFGFKWNMGWMHDTLTYFSKDPIHRRWHHNQLTFGLLYAFNENFVLPLSHDEVVHGKGSLFGRMPGDRWQKFANLRAYYAFMWAHPGKKLLFMGGEFAQPAEWNFNASLDWHLLDYPEHAQVSELLRSLNYIYGAEPALYELDFQPEGFEWIDCQDAESCVVSWIRWPKDRKRGKPLVVVCNFTPVVRQDYRIGFPYAGAWREAINTDAAWFGGSGVSTGAVVDVEPVEQHGRPASASLTLPPLATVYYVPEV